MKAAQMTAEGKISFEITCLISGNQRKKKERFPADDRRRVQRR
jgi:hypothetical protein